MDMQTQDLVIAGVAGLAIAIASIMIRPRQKGAMLEATLTGVVVALVLLPALTYFRSYRS